MSIFLVFVNGKYVDEYELEDNAKAHVEMAKKLGNQAYYQLEGQKHQRIPLSQTQLKVLCLIGLGWPTTPGNGMGICINGRKVCNVDTMMSLAKRGLAEQVVLDGKAQVGQWQATEYGRNLAKQLRN